MSATPPATISPSALPVSWLPAPSKGAVLLLVGLTEPVPEGMTDTVPDAEGYGATVLAAALEAEDG